MNCFTSLIHLMVRDRLSETAKFRRTEMPISVVMIAIAAVSIVITAPAAGP